MARTSKTKAQESGPQEPTADRTQRALLLDPDSNPPEDLWSSAVLDPLVAATFRNDRPDLLDQSPAGYDRALACVLARMGFSNQQLVDSVLARRRTHGQPPRLTATYYEDLLARARSSTTGSDEILRTLAETIDEDGVVPSLADWVEDRFHLAMGPDGRTFVFENGRYVPARPMLQSVSRTVLEQSGTRRHWSPELPRRLDAYLSSGAPGLWPHPGDRFLNVLNGLIDLEAGVLLPHNPRHLSTVQLPINFDPTATCPTWDKFITTTFPADAGHVAYELVALTMVPSTSVQKAVLLVGRGGNGKSTFLRGLQAFLGAANYSTVSLHRLEADRFSTARLDGKLANICPDLPAKDLAGVSMFKSISGGDVVIAEWKFQNSFNLRPFARLIFSCNTPPRAPDAGDAFFERWYVVPLERNFRGSEDEIPAAVLDARLEEPAELSGLLNRALASLPGVRARGINEPPSLVAARETFRAATDPIHVWLDQHTEMTPRGVVAKKALVDAYNAHVCLLGDEVVTSNGFGRALRKARPSIRSTQRRIEGRVTEVWVGIRLMTNTPPPDMGVDA